MLCKWLWKLENTEGTWQHLLSRKYLHNQVLTNATSGPGFSHFWKSLLGVNLIFQQYAKRILNNGKKDFVMGRCGVLGNWKLMKFQSQGFILAIEIDWDLSAHKFI
jgi:hypothetical protein